MLICLFQYLPWIVIIAHLSASNTYFASSETFDSVVTEAPKQHNTRRHCKTLMITVNARGQLEGV